MTKRKIGYLAALTMAAATAIPAMAQAGGDATVSISGAASAKKSDNVPSPAQQQQRQLKNIKKILGSTDEEFAVLSPKIERILKLRLEANLPGSGAGHRVGGGGIAATRNPDGSPLPPVLFARAELQNVIQDPNASAELINNKLEAYRAALSKAQDDLASAQKDLIALLTPHQEALLVLFEVLN